MSEECQCGKPAIASIVSLIQIQALDGATDEQRKSIEAAKPQRLHMRFCATCLMAMVPYAREAVEKCAGFQVVES